MATILQLIQGATTVDLNDVTNTEPREDYTPTAGGKDELTTAEAVTIIVKGASVAGLMATRSAIVEMLQRARDWQAGRLADPVYIKFQPDGATSAWRSRIHGFSVSNEMGVFSVPWDNLITELTISWERDNFWEAFDQVQLALSNTNASGNTSGLTVYNTNDGSGAPPTDRVNYTDISGAAVTGDLPSPLRLEITNNFNNASGVALIYAGLLTYGDIPTFNPLLEAEAAAGGVNSADATASGGNISTYTITNSGDVQMFTWTLSAALMAACAGRTFKVIARFVSGFWTNVWFSPQVFNTAALPLEQGSLVRPSDYYARLLRDLGAVQLPPWLAGVGSPGALELRLYGRRAVQSSLAIGLDFLFLMPTDSFREYAITGQIPYQSVMVDDGPNNRQWVQDSVGNNRAGIVTAVGDPLLVVPGRNARIFFLHHLVLGDSAPVARTLSIKAYYRPRRLTI